MTSRLFNQFAAIVVGLTCATAAWAQSAFSPAVQVNDRIVTYYEIEQRALLLAVMNTTGDLREIAREQLIDDRLKLEAAEIIGIFATEDGINQGVANFAKQVELTPEDFVRALAGEGIDEETMRDFVAANITWQGVVRNRFGARIEITEDEIDRAITANSGAGGIRVLLSEIVMPATAQTRDDVTLLAAQLSEIRTYDDFAEAARTYSAASTKDDGGHIDWMPITRLPANLRPLLAALGPGEVTPPVQLPNAVAVFQMRGIQESGLPAPSYSAIDYAALHIPGARTPEQLARARSIESSIDRCDDLFAVARDNPSWVLTRESVAPNTIPRDIALELARLDENEVSTSLTTENGQSLVFLMLCGRTPTLDEELSREDIAQALRQQRFESFAESYLAQLKAEAIITVK